MIDGETTGFAQRAIHDAVASLADASRFLRTHGGVAAVNLAIRVERDRARLVEIEHVIRVDHSRG